MLLGNPLGVPAPAWCGPAGLAPCAHPFEVIAVDLLAIDEACIVVCVVLETDLFEHHRMPTEANALRSIRCFLG